MKKKAKSRRYKGVDRTNYGQYTPNEVNPILRFFYILTSIVIILIGVNGLINDDLYIKIGYKPGIHFTGNAAIIMFFSLVCLIANLISFVIDHYDRRRNEKYYKKFRKWTEILGWVTFVLAILIQLTQNL